MCKRAPPHVLSSRINVAAEGGHIRCGAGAHRNDVPGNSRPLDYYFIPDLVHFSGRPLNPFLFCAGEHTGALNTSQFR